MAAINDLINKIEDPELRRRIEEELKRLLKQKKFGLVFEDHIPEGLTEGPIYPTLEKMDEVCNAPDSTLWHALIEADNYYALQLLAYLYPGMVDCIYIDPPYNSRARDWKYNNDCVDSSDQYRHSKWLSMMKRRLMLAKKLLNPRDSVLIVTIDEKEYLHLGCLLEELFPEARMQMISSVINSAGVSRGEFSRSNEFIYFIKFGVSEPQPYALSEEWRGNTKGIKKERLVWNQLMRAGTNCRRVDRPNLFYLLFVRTDGEKILEIGEPIDIETSRETILPIENTKVIFPIRSNGEEGNWQVEPKTLRDLAEKGYVRLGSFTEKGMAITYLKSGERKKIENGTFEIVGYRKDGSVIESEMLEDRKYIPGSQWDIPSHNATYFGTQLLNKIIGGRFPFPKSLYAVHDTIRFFVANKPNALIVDFFAGSGTTLHAVNLLNAEDGGHRRCIMVTNNEVSEQEARTLTKQGYKPGDEEWERLGIARYVNWPRTVCSIEGNDVNGQPLKGEYLGTDHREMKDGFEANCIFFKLGFLDKTQVALGRQFRELIPLLWMKAGSYGPCPQLETDEIPDMMVLPDNRFAVLTDEKRFGEFVEKVESADNIQMVYLVVDSDSMYREMAHYFPRRDTCQLYRDYLDNFRINQPRK